MSELRPYNDVDELNLALLKIAYPEFRFQLVHAGRRVRWVAVRRNSTAEGLHTMVTADLDELLAVLHQAIPTVQVPSAQAAEPSVPR